MKHAVVIIGLLAMPVVFTACKLTARLPFYVEANEPLPRGAEPYEVRREHPYPVTLIEPALEERGMLNRSVDYFVDFARALLPEDVAERNREKLQRAIGRPIEKKLDRTNPVHADPFPDIDVILALSGGGMRAANLSSAVLIELSKVTLEGRNGAPVTLLDAVDTISSVSGGGFAAAFYLYHRSVFRGNDDFARALRHEDLLQVAMRENIQRRLLDSLVVPTKLSFYIRGTTRATRTNLYSNLIEYRIIRPQRIESLEAALYPRWWRKRKVISAVTSFFGDVFWILSPLTPDDQYLFKAKARTFDDLYLRSPENPNVLYPLRPEWIPNSTDFNAAVEENRFLFEAGSFNRFRSNWLDFRVSDATAASAAFPVMFTPLSLRDWSAPEPTWQFLFDGGVSDNQGMNGVLLVLERQPPGRKTVVIMVDASPRAGPLPGKSPDRPGGIAITNRALERYMNSLRRDTINSLRERERERGLRFFHLSIRPGEFGAPLSEADEALLEAANRVPTALSISRGNQETLFEVGRLLVARHREALIAALTAPAAPETPAAEPTGDSRPPGGAAAPGEASSIRWNPRAVRDAEDRPSGPLLDGRSP